MGEKTPAGTPLPRSNFRKISPQTILIQKDFKWSGAADPRQLLPPRPPLGYQILIKPTCDTEEAAAEENSSTQRCKEYRRLTDAVRGNEMQSRHY
ncbi:hypothetical protein E2C01_046953 [Portunus trituberculatus]|uniref:Uncharacterized protein n=1 Tax=Portunus trituberculatus TaxID=210409 RepID=A0A5B7G656_PORTR|nr:hypothetical protein [Portunus trituberculatus]